MQVGDSLIYDPTPFISGTASYFTLLSIGSGTANLYIGDVTDGYAEPLPDGSIIECTSGGTISPGVYVINSGQFQPAGKGAGYAESGYLKASNGTPDPAPAGANAIKSGSSQIQTGATIPDQAPSLGSGEYVATSH